MVLQIRILSNEDAHFMRTLEISPKENFHRLHQALQEMLKNNPAQMAKFHLADEEWDPFKEVEVDDSQTVETDDDLQGKHIGKYLKQDGDKVIYEFDLQAHRSLFLEVARLVKGKRKAPVFTQSLGTPPPPFIDKKKKQRRKPIEEDPLDPFDTGEFDDYTELFGDIDEFY